MTDDTLPDLPLPALIPHHAREHGDRIAVRHRRGEEWFDVSWNEYARGARDCAAGMLQLGIDAPLHSAILGENSLDWLTAQMATGLLGGVPLGCYPTSSTPDLLHALGHADVQVLFCENDAFLAKVEPIRVQLPKLKWIVMFGGEAASAGDEGIITLTELERMGEEALAKKPDMLDASIASLSLDDVGLIVYTSGSTGAPKAAMLTYRNMRTTVQGFRTILGFDSDTVVLSYLPLCHIAEQAMTNFAPLYCGSKVVIGGGLPDLAQDMLEARPTYFSGVPRVWLRFRDLIVESFAAQGRSADLEVTLKAGTELAYRPTDGWNETERNEFARHAAFRAEALAMIGMDRTAVATSGAASLPVDVLTFFRALGLNLLELYGMTENCSIMTIHRPERVIPGTVGEPVSTVDLRIAEDGEILVRGDSVFAGYYKNPRASADAVADGWLHTGDVGVIEQGQLRIIDRKKDIMITDGGKNISPAEIEALMRTSPLIQECVLVADGRKYVSALIQIDPAALPGDHGSQPYELAAASVEAISEVSAEVRRLNEDLPRVAQIKRALILPQPLQQDEGELTPTLKLRRFKVHQRYEDAIERVYSGESGFDIYKPIA